MTHLVTRRTWRAALALLEEQRQISRSVARALRECGACLRAEQEAHAQTRAWLAEALRELDHDPVTGLHTRRWLVREWTALHAAGLLLLDLDGFKAVNDRYGHAAGDEVLAAVGARLLGQARAVGVRLHGDEMVVVLTDVQDAAPQHIAAAAAWVAGLVAAPVALAGERLVSITASVGAVTCAGDGPLELVLQRADHAMYTCKRGGGRPVVWSPVLGMPPAAGDRRRRVRDGVEHV